MAQHRIFKQRPARKNPAQAAEEPQDSKAEHDADALLNARVRAFLALLDG